MKQIETLMNIEMGKPFDTPKKLNRSTDKIPADIIDQLEDSKFTCEMLASLSKEFPVFHYKTCVTIHGLWSDIGRRQIGGYMNILQNKNGSVEVRYSAIDADKIERVTSLMRSIGKSGWHYRENSSARCFIMSESVTRETLPTVKPKYLAAAERLKGANIYGTVNVFLQATMWGGIDIVCHINIMAIPETEVMRFCLLLAGITQAEWDERVSTETKAQEAYKKRRDEEHLQYQAKLTARREATHKLIKEKYMPAISHLPEGTIHQGTVVIVKEKDRSGDSENAVGYVYRRIDGKGSFGKMKWSEAQADEYTDDVSKLTFRKMTEKKAHEFKTTGRLVPAGKR